MPKAWSDKDERMYDHIKKRAEDRGKSEDRAEEIAARTVNKQRREEGRTESQHSKATGNPNLPYEERTKKELYNLAEKYDIHGRGDMDKDELIKALRNR